MLSGTTVDFDTLHIIGIFISIWVNFKTIQHLQVTAVLHTGPSFITGTENTVQVL